MVAKTSSHNEALLASLADPDEAMHYLNAALAESPESLHKARQKVVEARLKVREETTESSSG